MAARTSLFDDLMLMASRLPWRVSTALAAVSGIALHAVAAALSTPVAAKSVADIGTVYTHGILGILASFGQFIVPAGFLVGAAVSFRSHSKARSLFATAREKPRAVVTQMTWREFERLVGEAFRRRGFAVLESGGASPDGGVDLVLTREGKRYLVQCKHWRVQSVGVGVVRELNGVVEARGAAGGYVVTSGIFTREAWVFAQTCPIELIDGEKLGSLIREVDRKRAEEGHPPCPAPVVGPSPTARSCPQCGSAMARRIARRGPYAGQEFWGCVTYPKCRGVVPTG
jgi:restriction system protein